MTVTVISVSLPDEIADQIDNERGDISRSTFVLRLIEDGFKSRSKRKE